jgi:hypothetical protein
MRRVLSGIRRTYANVVATVALVLAAFTGGAIAAAKIGAKQIRANAIRALHLGFGLGVGGKQVTLDTRSDGTVQSLVATQLRLPDKGMALPTATIEMTGVDGGDVDLTLVVDGRPVGARYSHTVVRGKTQTVTLPMPAPLPAVRRGVHRFAVRAMAPAGAVTFKDVQIDVIMAPAITAVD